MWNIWTIAKREYKHYFISPIAYMVSFLVLLVLGIIFYTNIVYGMSQQVTPDITIVISPLVTVLLFTTPAITMRALAEEQKMGTLELLLTAPVRDWELVVGKWLGGFLFLMTLVIITGLFPIVLNSMVQPGIDQGMMIAGYLGLMLMVASFVAIGVAVSSLFSNQIAAFFACLAILLVAWLIGTPAQNMTGAGGDIIRYLDMSEHFYNTFFVGIIELKDVVFFLSVTALALFLGTMSIEVRRWR